MRLAALITAAGASTRMGTPKALVPWAPSPNEAARPLLLHQVGVLGEVCAAGLEIEPVVVVLGHAALEIRQSLAVPPWVTLVDHPEWARGRSSSLEVGAAALAGTAPDAVFIAAVDQPLIAAVVASLCGAWTDADEVLVPAHRGRRGHPILLSGRLLPWLAEVSTYPEGLRDLVRGARRRELDVDDPRIHLDLNTPEALAAFGQAAPLGRQR
jgi:CTP:molybdopterin cytidylyltransferase MocA